MATVGLTIEVNEVFSTKEDHSAWRLVVRNSQDPNHTRQKQIYLPDYERQRFGISSVYKEVADMCRAVIMDSRFGS